MILEALHPGSLQHLSKTQRKILRYITEHYEEAIFCTAASLSKQAEVSEASVVRLAQALGFDGYPAMQKALREDLHNRLSTVTRLEKSLQNVQHNGNLLSKVMQQDMENLSLTLQDIPYDTFQQAVTGMQEVQRIFVIGLRGSHAPALTLALYLRYLNKDAHLLSPGFGDVWNHIYDIRPDDLIIGISFPRYSRLTVEVIKYAHEQGAHVGVITDSLLSPLSRYAQWVLTARSRLDSFIESFTASMSIVNALLTALSVQTPEETRRILQDREALWKKKGIYLEDLPRRKASELFADDRDQG